VSKLDKDVKVGVFACHCGINISSVVNIPELIAYAKTLPNVAVAKEYKFMCSEIGQNIIKEHIEKGDINRVIVAACSPRMHEPTFRNTCAEAGLNQFLFEQANIREHVSWVYMEEHEAATEIAKDHVRMAVAKVSMLKPLEVTKVKVEPSCLIVGAGIAGMNAALDLSDQGFKVYLVERTPTIGGHMAQLDKTFPTMDCSACVITPKMSEVASAKNVELLTYSEVESIDGYVGNFQVKIKKKPHYINQDTCTACGMCAENCPVEVANEFDVGMKSRRAAYVPFPQAVPGQYTIDDTHCIRCGICKEICPPEAVNYDDKPEYLDVKVGTIILATGWDPFDPTSLKQYGYGKYPNVITGLQMERLLSSFGPTEGKPKRPSDRKDPHSVAFLQCVGSRDFSERGNPWCSRVCCMYALKQARQYKEKHPEASIYIFYMDIRAFGKGYEEFYESAGKDYGIKFIRGRIAEVAEGTNNNLILRAEDTLLKKLVELEVDMLVLSIGLEPRFDAEEVARLFNVQRTADGFLMEAHPKLRPVDTLTDGVFLAGVIQGPKDIPDAVSQAKGAASGAASLMAQGEVEIEPFYSIIIDHKCSGCKSCISLCAYNAIAYDEYKKVAAINEILCKGCGTCVAACPSGAIIQNQFSDSQILPMIETSIPEKTEVGGG
jgi:heterodisulfide reductase subunit A